MENKENTESKYIFAKSEFEKKNELKFLAARAEFEKNANYWEQYLFSKEFHVLYSEFKIYKDRNEIDTFILKLIALIDVLKFYPKKETIDKLKEFGIKNEVIKLMVSIDEIKNSLDTINQNIYLYIDPYYSILVIREYLMYKIVDAVQKNYGFTTTKKGNQKTKINSTAAYLNTIKRSHEYYNKNGKDIPIKTESDNEIYKLILDFPPETDPYKLLEIGLKGDIHNTTLKKLFYEPISFKFDKPIKVTDFYFNYYPLLRLMMPNEILSASELEAKADSDTRSLKSYFYQDIIKSHFHLSE